jgi:polyisoprenoid-binding protein YceI
MMRLKSAVISLIILIICAETSAQNLNLEKEQSDLKVEGTSSLHNWYVEATDMRGQIIFNLDSLIHIKKLTFLVEVPGLKAAKKGMIKKMRSTLQADKFSTIVYQFKKTDKITRVNLQKFNLHSTGNLTIAGVSKQITLNFIITVSNDSIIIRGIKKLKMTDFNIKPPKALLGIFKTGDKISISFNVIYKSTKKQ